MRNIEDLGREDLEFVVKGGKKENIAWASDLDIGVLVKQLLQTFGKVAHVKADFYLLAKDLEEPHP